MNPFAGLAAPPVEEGPAAVETWAAQLAARALHAAEQGTDPARTRWVSRQLRRLGQMKDKARHSYKLCQALAEYRGQTVPLCAEDPPAEPLALVVWAYFRLAHILHAAATDPAPLFDQEVAARWSLGTEAAATLGYLPQTQQLRALAAALREEACAGPRP